MSTYNVAAVGGSSSTYPPANDGSEQFTRFANNLLNLQRKDPEKLKTVLLDIAAKLNTTADHSAGKQAQVYRDLAQHYENAAKTGDLSKLNLFPPGL